MVQRVFCMYKLSVKHGLGIIIIIISIGRQNYFATEDEQPENHLLGPVAFFTSWGDMILFNRSDQN